MLAQKLIKNRDSIINGIFLDDADPGEEKIYSEEERLSIIKLIEDSTEIPLARFLAVKVYMNNGKDLNSLNVPKLISVLKIALSGNFTDRYSDWGFKNSNSDLGSEGVLFYKLGDAAIPYLKPMLNDTTEVKYNTAIFETDPLFYKRAFIPKVRIKDFYALYISWIKGYVFDVRGSLESRDQKIKKIAGLIN